MEIVIVNNQQELGAVAGKLILAQLKNKPDSVFGFATGSSPISTYQYLISDFKKNHTNWSQVKTFNLDEYVGLDNNHPQSYRYFMDQNLFNHLNILKNNITVPIGVGNYQVFAAEYDDKITQVGGVDLQVLGIGINGHIGFNEPNSDFTSLTRVVDLSPSTIEANARFFNSSNEVPKQAVSMGLKTIMNAKKIILLASGKDKAEAIYHLVKGNITPKWPCTILQNHYNVSVIVDEDAAEMIK